MVVRRVEASPAGILLAVADGHGGDETSSFVEQQLSDGLFDKMLAETEDPKEALKNTFQSLNVTTFQLSRGCALHYENGTTLSVAYVPDTHERAYIAIIGDSPVILARRYGQVHVSPEHNARSNKEEREEAEQRGGTYMDGYICSNTLMGLQMTRDIGFHVMGDILKRYPDVYDLTIDKGDILIVGSDGLLDPAHYSTEAEAKRLAELALEGAEARELVNDALRRETGDNVTAIVYRH